MKKKRKLRTDRVVAIFLLLLIAFFAGCSFGFREAEKIYEPTIQKSQSIIEDLKEELAQFQREKESKQIKPRSDSSINAAYLIPA